MNDDKKLTRAPLLGIEASAEWERHFQEADAMIADRLKLRLSHVKHQRETRFVYWEYLERKAKAMPPMFDTSAFAPGEYRRWSDRHRDPAGSRWDYFVWGAILLIGCIFFGERDPAVHEALSAFVKWVLP